MKKDDIIKLSLHIITEYYKNNLEPFFSYVSDDVLWLGPAKRQLIQGKKALKQAFALEKHSLTFTMGDIQVLYVSPHSHIREVLLHYDIFTHYPSGSTDVHNQWLHYTWCETKKETADGVRFLPEIVCLHISNVWPYDDRDTIYPVHYEHISAAMHATVETERYVFAKVPDGSVYRIALSRILYIATIKHSARLQIHTESGEIVITGTLSGFVRKYPDLFLRIHSGYLVNPAHVMKIRRFAVTMSDGTELPVPEKKYTQIKKLLLPEKESAAHGADAAKSESTVTAWAEKSV